MTSKYENSLEISKGHVAPDPKRLRRRLMTIPFMFAITGLITLFLPVLLTLSFLLDCYRRKSFSTLRTTVCIWMFLWLEIVFLGVSVTLWVKSVFVKSYRGKKFILANRRIQKRFCKIYVPMVLKIFRAKINIHGHDLLQNEKPAVVFTRHVSLLDTFVPLFALYSLGQDKWPRYVMKSELLNDPLFDVVGNRFPNVFIHRGKGLRESETKRILSLRNTMEKNETLVIYPEGTRFTSKKRKNLIQRSYKNGKMDLFKHANSLKNTLPPLTAGSLALLSQSMKCDLVVMAHRGFENVVTLWDLFKGSLIGKNIDIMITRYSHLEIPKDENEQKLFLMNIWKDVDNYAMRNS